MSTHKDCGEDITWVKRDDDPSRFMPPLEFFGYAYILSDAPNGEKTAVQVATYKTHHCDPDKVIAWHEYKARIAAIEQNAPVVMSKSDWEIARDRRQEETMRLAMKVSCPRCEVREGEPCISLAKGKTLGEVIKNPHQARLDKYDNGGELPL